MKRIQCNWYIVPQIFNIQGLAEKFIDRLRYFHEMEKRKFIFLHSPHLQSTHFFHWYCNALMPLVKKTSSTADISHRITTPVVYNWAIGQMSSVRQWPGRPGFNPWSSIQKIVLDAALLNTQHYRVRIKGKGEQSREWSNALPYTSVK